MPSTERIWYKIWVTWTMLGFYHAVVVVQGFGAVVRPPTQGRASGSFQVTQENCRNVWSLGMVPRYDPFTKRWVPTSSDEEASAGYPPIGSLLRQGPIPFFQRLKDHDQYDQAVLKMMATSDSTLTRNQAQGNMDAYLQNPNDWALQKFEEQKGAPTFDYANANMDSTSLVLTAAWAGVLLTLVGRIVYVSATGCDDFCRQYHW